jgi:hypothetical protein
LTYNLLGEDNGVHVLLPRKENQIPITPEGDMAKKNPEKGFNGWSNYETWAVKLWMDNDGFDFESFISDAKDAAKRSRTYPNQSKKSKVANLMAPMLNEYFEDSMPDFGATLWADLLGAAMSEVDWFEIAENIMDEYDDEEESEE